MKKFEIIKKIGLKCGVSLRPTKKHSDTAGQGAGDTIRSIGKFFYLYVYNIANWWKLIS